MIQYAQETSYKTLAPKRQKKFGLTFSSVIECIQSLNAYTIQILKHAIKTVLQSILSVWKKKGLLFDQKSEIDKNEKTNQNATVPPNIICIVSYENLYKQIFQTIRLMDMKRSNTVAANTKHLYNYCGLSIILICTLLPRR